MLLMHAADVYFLLGRFRKRSLALHLCVLNTSLFLCIHDPCAHACMCLSAGVITLAVRVCVCMCMRVCGEVGVHLV